MERKKRRWLWILLALLLIGAGVTTAIVLSNRNKPTPGPEPVSAEIYYNIDREDMLGQTASGISARKRNKDGTYTIRFLHDGKAEELKAKDISVVNAIDAKDIMGLSFDEEGYVTGVIDIEDMPVNRAAWRFFVKSLGKKKIKVNSSSTYEGISEEYTLTDDCKIYDMTGAAGEKGVETELMEKDRIYAFANDNDELYLIFVFYRGHYAESVTAYCRHCNMDVDWELWSDASKLPDVSGHYVLNADITLGDQQTILEPHTSICLDLNGHTVTGAQDSRVYALFDHDITLNIMDNSKEKSGVIKAVGESANEGGVVWVRFADDTLNLYGGTLDGSGYTVVNAIVEVNDSLVYVHKHGGTVSTSGTFNMYGGTVIGATTWHEKDSPWEYAGNGGAVCVLPHNDTENGVFNMVGGEVYGGTANAGGNIAVYGTMTMSGGKIYGGRIKEYGGKINPQNNMSNVFIVMGSLTMTGGEIQGYVNAIDHTKGDGVSTVINLSGTPVIYGAAAGCDNLYLNQINGDGVIVNVSDLGEGAKIGVRASGIFTTKTDAANAKYFVSDVKGASVVYTSGCLAVGGRYNCICGSTNGTHAGECTGKKELWLPWAETGYLPVESGYYYLTDNVHLTFQQGILKKNGKGQDVHLDLNGRTVTADRNVRIYALFDPDCSLTITDCSASKAGKLVVNGECSDVGMVIWVRYATDTFNMYQGTLDGSKVTLVTAEVGGSYIPVTGATLETAGTVNMYGGKIIGGKAYRKASTPAEYASNGGAVSIIARNDSINENGIFNMYGGEISGGKANAGGNVVCYGTLNMYGGKISGGMGLDSTGAEAYQNGPNIFMVNSTFEMSGGEVAGLVMSYGADSRVRLSGDAKIAGSDQYNLKLVDGAKVVVNGVLNTGEQANVIVDAPVGAVFATSEGITLFEEDTKFFESAIEGTEITLQEGGLAITLIQSDILACECGGKAAGVPGHVCTDIAWVEVPANTAMDPSFFAAGGAFKLMGDVRVTDQIIPTGAELHIDLNGYTLSGPHRIINTWGSTALTSLTITDSSEAGTGKIVASGTFDIEGGCIAACNNVVVKLYAGTLDASSYVLTSGWAGGSAVFLGGNAQFVQYGGEIKGGKSNSGGAAVDISAATASFVMNGGKIYGGESVSGDAGAVRVAGSLIMNGGEISGGTAALCGGCVKLDNGASFAMNGGKISGGTSVYAGKNLYAWNGNITLAGGEIAGNVYADGTTTIKMSGAPKILGGTDYNLNLGDSAQLIIEAPLTVGETPNVGITATPGRIIAKNSETVTLTEADKAFFSADNADNFFELSVEGILLSAPTQGCECGGKATGMDGHTCQNIIWTKVAANTNLSHTFFENGGNFILMGDVTVDDQISINGSATELHIDLNGYTLTRANGERLISCWSASALNKLTITDSSEAGSGKLLAKGTFATEGGLIAACQHVTVVIYAGTLDASEYELTSTWAGGSAIYIDPNATVIMYGGKILGGSSTQDAGAVDIRGTFIMNGGEISGGSAALCGGCIKVQNGASFTMNGGKISGGTSVYAGKNVFSWNGNVALRGGEIAGNVYMDGTSVVKLSGAPKILGGTDYNLALADTAGIVIDGALTVGEVPNVGITATPGRVFATASGITFAATDANFFAADSADNYIEPQEGGIAISARVKGCECGGKAAGVPGHTCTNIDWTEVPANTNLSHTFFENGGSFKLMGDVTVDSQISIGSAVTELHIDLNGYTLTRADGDRLISCWGAGALERLTITDSSEAGTGKLLAKGTHATEGGIIAACQNVTVIIYAGTLDATDYNLTSEYYGGPAVYVNSNATLIMYGGKILGGSSAQDAGAVDIRGTFIMNGGEISGGSAALCGGCVKVQNGANFTMNGGKISGGTSVYAGKNVFSWNGNVALRGGEIAGNVYMDGTSVVKLSGAPKILGGTDYNLALADTANIVIDGELTVGETPNVGITATTDRIFATAETLKETDKAFFKADPAGTMIAVKEGGFAIVVRETKYCECGDKATGLAGHTCQDITWTEVAANDAMDPNYFANGGAFRLMGNVNVTDQINVSSTATELHIDLNGYTLSRSSGSRVISTWGASNLAKLTITDSSEAETGKIVATGLGGQEGGCIALCYGTGILYGGTLDASAYSLTATGSWAAGAVFIANNATFIMNGGKIYGGTTLCSGAAVDIHSANASFVLNRGTVYGGTTTGADACGGAINVEGTFTMNGGMVSGGTTTAADAGTVFVKGTFNMNGGEIVGGRAAYCGGCVKVYPDAHFNMAGGKISGGTSDLGWGGAHNIQSWSGIINLTGGEIVGEFIADGSSVVTMSGAPKILGGPNFDLKLGDAVSIVINGALTVGTTPNVGITRTVNTAFATAADGIVLTDGDRVFFLSRVDDATVELSGNTLVLYKE